MKIRIKDNSLRLRLTQSEVAAFEQEKHVSAIIHFPNGTGLTYRLEWSDQSDYAAIYSDNVIQVRVPQHVGLKWLDPTEVGMETKVKLSDDSDLKLLIEKDFACLTERVDEDESDNFPNPLSNC